MNTNENREGDHFPDNSGTWHPTGWADDTQADFILTPPPPTYPYRALGWPTTIRGHNLIVASFHLGTRTPTYHRGLTAWGETYPIGLNRTRIDVVTTDAWWRHKLLGTLPDKVTPYPAEAVWIEDAPTSEDPPPPFPE